MEIQRTHDHPWLKDHLPETLRHRRRLTKIEHGIDKKGDAIDPPPASLAMILTQPGLYKIPGHLNIFLYGDYVEELLVRINHLSRSILGSAFLQEFETRESKAIIALEKWEGHIQVVVSYPREISVDSQVPEKSFPLEWTTYDSREECDRILREIGRGEGSIYIDNEHPEKEKIFDIFHEFTMRPSGAELLKSIDRFKQKNGVRVQYEKGKNNHYARVDGLSFVCIDLEASSGKKSSLNKKFNRYVRAPKWSQATVAHELIHALHAFYVVFNDEKKMDLESLLDGASFLEKEGRYEIEADSMSLYKNHTKYEEQRTILGVRGDPNPPCPLTENSIRYEWFQPLRIEHVSGGFKSSRFFSPDTIIRENPFELDDFQVAIYKRDIFVALSILGKMNRKKTTISLKSAVGKIQELNSTQRLSLYTLIEKAIVFKKIFSTFVIRNLSRFMNFKIEKEDVRKLCFLLRHKVTKKNLKQFEKELKNLHNLAITSTLPKEKLFLTRLLNRI